MTQQEFYYEMAKLKEEYIDEKYDKESFHMEADKLMCDLLVELGYGDGVQLFQKTPKWYT